MTTENLKKTVSILYEMELEQYFMEKAIEKINVKSSKLAVSEPGYTVKMKPLLVSFVCSIIGGIAGFIVGAIFGGYMETVLGAFAGITIGFLIFIPVVIWDWYKEYRRYNKEIDVYKKELREKKILIGQKNLLVKKKEESAAKLNRFYQGSGIDASYCNIIAIGYMKDFLNLGICSKLEGVDGLYYAIRKEIRWDKMQETVGDISHKLDASIATQNAIREDLRRMSKRSEEMLNNIANEMKSMGYNQSVNAVAAYNSERIRKELEYQNYILRYGR